MSVENNYYFPHPDDYPIVYNNDVYFEPEKDLAAKKAAEIVQILQHREKQDRVRKAQKRNKILWRKRPSKKRGWKKIMVSVEPVLRTIPEAPIASQNPTKEKK